MPPSPSTVLVLRTCNADLSSYGDFKWPRKGLAEAPDWKPTTECGNGLHGLLWGEGDGYLVSWSDDAKWLVVEVKTKDIVDLGNKVKFPRGEVLFCGTREKAIARMEKLRPEVLARQVVGAVRTSGDRGTSTSGYGGTSISGYGGVLSVRWYDAAKGLYRVRVAEVDGETFKPGIRYGLTERGEWEVRP